MPISRYGVVKGHIRSWKLLDEGSHGELRLETDDYPPFITATINTTPKSSDSELAYCIGSYCGHSQLFTQLSDLSHGFHVGPMDQVPSLDLLRQDLVKLDEAGIIPFGEEEGRNDIVHEFFNAISNAVHDRATAYVFGCFGSGSRSAHNIHMNQRSSGDFQIENGSFKDGGIFIEYADGHWDMLLIAFGSQNSVAAKSSRPIGQSLSDCIGSSSTRKDTKMADHIPNINTQNRDSGDDDTELDAHVSEGHDHSKDATGIRRRTEICQDLFEACQRWPILLEGDWIDKMSADFTWWSLGIGAGKSGHSSLDHRVQTRDDVRDVLVSLLDSLVTSLRNCIKIAKTSQADADSTEKLTNDSTHAQLLDEELPDLDEQKYYIRTSLKYLSKISAAIRKSGTKFRHQRVDNLLKERAPKLREFQNYLRYLVLIGPAKTHLLSWILYRHTLTVDPMWKTMWITLRAYLTDVQRLSPVQERLIQANLIRRNRFDIYFRRCERKVEGEKGLMVSATNARAQAEPITSNLDLENRLTSTPSLDQRSKPKLQIRDVPLQQAATVDTSALSSQPATGIGSFVMPQRPRTQGTRSVSTKFSQGVLKQDYPKCPIADGKTFWCPFCAQPLDDSYSDPKKNKKWRGHVAEDLNPYVCIYPDCDMPDVMYVTTEDWKKHLRDRHSAPRWICDPCWLESDNPIEYEFDLEEGWYEHILTEHEGEFDESDLPDLANVSLRTVVPPVACPLCYGNTPLLQPETDKHIAEHLHTFALQALPWRAIGRDDDTRASVGSDVMKAALLEDRDESEEEENWDEIYDLPRLIFATMSHRRSLMLKMAGLSTLVINPGKLEELFQMLSRLSERYMAYDSDLSLEIGACLAKLDRIFQTIDDDDVDLMDLGYLENLEAHIDEGLTSLNTLVELGEQKLNEFLASKSEKVDSPGKSSIPDQKSIMNTIRPLFQSLLNQASAKLLDSITDPFEPEPQVERICGPGADPIFDKTIFDLARIAKQQPKILVDSMMLWRKKMSDALKEAQSELQLMENNKLKGSLPQRHPAPLHDGSGDRPPTSKDISSKQEYVAHQERRSTVSIYILCRVLLELIGQSDLETMTLALETKLEEVFFNQLKNVDIAQLMTSPLKLANWNMFARLLGQMCDINFSGVTARFLQELESSFRKLAEPSISLADSRNIEGTMEVVLGGMKSLQIKISPRDCWEESCDFLISLSRLFNTFRGSRFKLAFCQIINRLLLSIAAKAGNHHTLRPRWYEVLNAIAPILASMSSDLRKWTVTFPLQATILCVSPPNTVRLEWLQLILSQHTPVKDKATAPLCLQVFSQLIWTYLYRIDDEFQTAIANLDEVMDLVLPSSERSLISLDPAVTAPLIQMIRVLGFKYPEYCFRTVISPLIEAELFTGSNDVHVEKLDPDWILVGIRAFLYVMSDLEKGEDGRLPFPQFYDAPPSPDWFQILVSVPSPQNSPKENILRPISTDALSDGVRECYLKFCQILSRINIVFSQTFDDEVISNDKVLNIGGSRTSTMDTLNFTSQHEPHNVSDRRKVFHELFTVAVQALPQSFTADKSVPIDAYTEFSNAAPDGETRHYLINQYRIQEEIGIGSYGTVRRATDQFGNEFAVKEFSKARLRRRTQSHILRQGPQNPRRGSLGLSPASYLRSGGKKDALVLIREEVAIFKKLNHPNLVQLIEVLDDPEKDSLYMVMEMCERGVVMKVGLDEQAEPLEEDQCRIWFCDLILAVEYLHAQGIVHRNLKPYNLLLSDDGVLKVDAFGSAEIFDKPNQMRFIKSARSPAFLPPEQCGKLSDVADTAGDIWSMGVSLYCLKYGRVPFSGDSLLELFDAIRSDDPELPEDENPGFVDLMSKILDKIPETRINMAELRNHPWVTYQGADPLLSAEENCMGLVDPPNELEVNHAFTRRVDHLGYVGKAVSHFKRNLAKNRSDAMASSAGFMLIPLRGSLDTSKEMANTETIKALPSQRHRIPTQDLSGGDAQKTTDNRIN